jgi:hypothetical protein
MTDDILRIRDFNPKSTLYSKLETNSFGGKKMWVNYQGRKNFRMQLPRMHAPFGVSEFTDQNTGKSKYYLNLSFSKGQDMNGILKMFHEKLGEWDEKVVDDASNNTVAWFKKPANKLTKKAVQKNYTSMLSRYKDKQTLEYTGEYPDKVKLKMPFFNDEFSVEVYDENANRVGVDYITPNCEIIAVIKSSSLWISSDKFGVSLSAGVLQVFPPSKLTGYSFLPDLEPQATEQQAEESPAAEVEESPVEEEEESPEEEEEESPEEEEESPAEEEEESPAEEEASPEETPEESSSEEDDVKIESEETPEPEPVPEPVPEPKKKKRAAPSRATGTKKPKAKKSKTDEE